MAAYSEHFYESHDGLSLFYREYGQGNPGVPIICLHGIARNSRDFEDFAAHTGQRRHVLALDFRGRGHSAHDPNWENYHPQTYADDVATLLQQRNFSRALLVGTSLGGLVATIVANIEHDRIAGIVLNDIAPAIGVAGLQRIETYLGRLPAVATWDEAVAQAREVYGIAWPGLSDAMWQRIARRGYRENENRVPQLDMDLAIGDAARKVGAGLDDPWGLFDGLANIPLLVLQGATSDILTDELVARMQEHKPDLEHLRVADRGHPLLLDEPECIAALDRFIEENNA